jgi:hypothetical protein
VHAVFSHEAFPAPLALFTRPLQRLAGKGELAALVERHP